MQKSIEIVKMEESDLDEVMKIERASFKYPWFRFFFESDLSRPNAYLWVAKEGEKLLGYLVAYHTSDELHIANIAVAEEERRRGIGSLLIEKTIELAKNLKVLRIFLEVRPSNLAAINLYKKFGFEIVGRRNHYYQDGEDALLMEKNI